MKILFISYYFKPNKTVAAQRVSYWAENILAHLPQASVDVVTTSEQDNNNCKTIDHVFVVPDVEKGPLSQLIKTDKGATWYYALKKFFSKSTDTYDVVILTGNPFVHFFIAKYLKNIMRCHIILDFRDPFAKNERSALNGIVLNLKKKVLTLFEYYFCEYADKIITMNSHCSDLLCSRRRDIVEIIDNGYDEKKLERAKEQSYFSKNSALSLVYLGSFARDRNVENLLVANENLSSKFNVLHIGKLDPTLENDTRINCTGLISYTDAIGYAKAADVGIIIASGKKFESTTKIFDYIGMNLPILIITNGEPKIGNVQEVVKDYPLVWWAENKPESIEKVLIEISNNLNKENVIEFDSSSFSRATGLRKLVNLIKSFPE
ncbi:MAG: glycosyltransferase family 4 protein [Alteromonadales bacterium]|nr:glycosyltransferase family 4 protein [Alteromonadales bacterium]